MIKDPAILQDILKAARRIREFTSGLSKIQFESDEKTQSAVLHQLLVLGEAVKRLSEDLRHAHPEIPWKNIAGMRDKLIHAYDDVDLDEVWKTITVEIPEIIAKLILLIPSD